jgi:hypothetical protein
VIQGTFGVIQGTFGVIQGIFGVIQHQQGKNNDAPASIMTERCSRMVHERLIARVCNCCIREEVCISWLRLSLITKW